MIENTNNYCTLYIVRHGETEWNVSHIVQGQSDSPLTDKGVEQVKNTAEEFKNIEFAAIFSSDSGRAQRSAEIIKLDRELAIMTSESLRERNYGGFEGRQSADFKNAIKEIREKINELSEAEQKVAKLADDIESDAEIVSRFITKLREISVAYPGKNVLVTCHGGPIRTFLEHVGYFKFGELPPGTMANAGYIKVLCDGIDFQVKQVKGINK